MEYEKPQMELLRFNEEVFTITKGSYDGEIGSGEGNDWNS